MATIQVNVNSGGQHGQPMMMQQQPGMMMQQPGMMMQQPMMMQPGMMMKPGGNFEIVQIKTGMEKLAENPGVFIKQKFDLLEALTGCETENRYNIYRLSKDGMDSKGKPIFKAKEKSSCCNRLFCVPACRPYQMFVENEDKSDTIDGTPFMHMDRPFTCTYLCLARPFADVFLTEKDANEKLGVIRAPFTCYNYQINIHNDQDDVKYKIEANCCQLGFFCKWPCDPCQHIHFDVKDPSGDKIGSLEKFSQGCLKASVDGGSASNFSVEFPGSATTKDKALFIAATLFMDLRFFEEKPGKNNQLM